MDSSIENNDIKQKDTHDKLSNTEYMGSYDFSNINELFVDDQEVFKNEEFENKILAKMYLFRDIEKAEAEFSQKLKMSINSSFDSVKLICKDSFDKEHYFILKFSHMKYKIKEHTLPKLDALNAEFTDLCTAINEFSKCLCEVEEYLEVMDDIDTNCWVIDPKNATHKDNYRRIMIDKDLSAMITVDVECAQKPPIVKLLGRSKVTNPLMEKIRENINLWDIDEPFITNLLNLFGLEQFLYKDDIDMGETEDVDLLDKTCCICLSDRDEKGFITSVECEKATCKQNFHATCLFQWLSAVSSNLRRFKHVHGECPSCSASISCPTDF